MGQYVTSRSWVTPSTTIKDSEQAAYPASNVTLLTRPYRPWKSNNTFATTNYVGVDLTASPATVQYIVVDNVNVDKVVIEGDTSTSFNTAAGLPEYSSGNAHLTIEYDMYSRGAALRRKVIHYVGGVAKRYWRVRPGTGAAITDGDSKFYVGSFGVLNGYTSWAANTGPELGKECVWPALLNDDQLSGGRNPVEVGQPYARIYIPPTDLLSEMESTLATVNSYGEHRPFLFWQNSEDGNGDTDYSNPYIVHRVGSARIAKSNAGMISLAHGMVLEEVALG